MASCPTPSLGFCHGPADPATRPPIGLPPGAATAAAVAAAEAGVGALGEMVDGGSGLVGAPELQLAVDLAPRPPGVFEVAQVAQRL